MANENRGVGCRLPNTDELRPGQMVRVIKRLRFQDEVHPVIVEGRLVEVRQVRTESSFAGGPGGRFEVQEVVLEKSGGERSVVLVDQWTEVRPTIL